MMRHVEEWAGTVAGIGAVTAGRPICSVFASTSPAAIAASVSAAFTHPDGLPTLNCLSLSQAW